MPRSATLTQVGDSAGIQLAIAPAADAAPPWRLRVICSLGGAAVGPEAIVRADQTTVVTDGDSRIYVLRPEDRTVEAFDADCRHLASMGRAGSGPGEMRTPTSIAVSDDGGIAVFDAARQVRVRWDNTFQLLPEIHWDAATSLPNGPLRIHSDGAVFLSARGGSGTMTHLLTAIRRGERSDLDSVVNPFPAPVMSRCGMQLLDPVFTARPVWTMRDSLVVFASTAAYEIRLYGNSELRRIVRRPGAAVPASAADVARAHPEGERIGSCTISPGELADQIGVAERRPILEAVALDGEHRLWVQRWVFPDERVSSDLYGADGRYLGTFPDVSAPLGSLRDQQLVIPVRDRATDLVRLTVFVLEAIP